MTDSVTGVVKAVARNQKAFTIEGQMKPDGTGDIWFSARNASQLAGAAAGSTVEFPYKINPGAKGDFYNIQGNVKVINPGTGAAAGATTVISSTPAKGVLPKVGAVVLDRERCIVRQNAANVAAQIMQSMTFGDPSDHHGISEMHREIAKYVEEYTSGDLDDNEAKEKLAAKKAAADVDTMYTDEDS